MLRPRTTLTALALAAALLPSTISAQEPGSGFNPGRDSRLRAEVEDMRRIGLVTGIREPQWGLLQLTVGPAFTGENSIGYHLQRLYFVYTESLPIQVDAVVLELFRGDQKIGEYTGRGLTLRTRPPEPAPPAARGLPPPSAEAEAPGVAPAPDLPYGRAEALRVFLDCAGYPCDYDFFRTDIAFVNHVRNRQDAQVLVLITTRETGGGGTEFTASLHGQRDFGGTDDSLRLVTRPAESEDQIRRALADLIRRGLVRYVNHTPLAEGIRVSYVAPGEQRRPLGPVRDPWHYWAFGLTLDGSVNGEKAFTYIGANASLSANRTTEAWKISTTIQGGYNENRVQVSDISTVRTVTRDYGVDALVVGSLGAHWSAGLEGTLTSSTFLNQSWALRLAPALEYDLFPYGQSTRRQLTIEYSIGATAFQYREETIFGKTKETLLDQRLVTSLILTQPWGSVVTSVEGSHYLHDLSKWHGLLANTISLNLFGGFSLRLVGGLALVHDQLYLARTGATQEEILLRQRELATSYRYWSSIGFGYTFGSPFANVVNPRLGGSTGAGVH